MRIYQARREKLSGSVSSSTSWCYTSGTVSGRVVGSGGRVLTLLYKCIIQSTAVSSPVGRR